MERDFMDKVVPKALARYALRWWRFKKGFTCWETFKDEILWAFLPEEYGSLLMRDLER